MHTLLYEIKMSSFSTFKIDKCQNIEEIKPLSILQLAVLSTIENKIF